MCAGGTETIKGLLAFVSSPVFGRLSDKIGNYSFLKPLSLSAIFIL